MRWANRYRAERLMRISVILPTKDRGPAIDRTMDALLAQSLPQGDYEVVVDLVAGGHNWFSEWTGRPLAKRIVRVQRNVEAGS